MPNKSIFYRQPHFTVLLDEVKQPFKEAIDTLMNPKSNPFQKANAGRKLLEVLEVIRNKLPEPTIDNTRKPGTHILIGIRDRFFKRLVFPAVERYVKPMVNFGIIIYDTDLYDQFIDWWVWEIKKSDWPPLRPFEPDPHYFKDE